MSLEALALREASRQRRGRRRTARAARRQGPKEPRHLYLRLGAFYQEQFRAFHADPMFTEILDSLVDIVAIPDDEAGARRLAIVDRVKAQRLRTDAKDPVISKRLEDLRLLFATRVSEQDVAPRIRQIAEQTGSFNAKQLTRILGIGVREDLGMGGKVEEFMRRNLRLLRNMADQELGKIGSVLDSAMGLRHEDIRQMLVERLKMDERRAALVARDQVLKLNADISHERQTAIGIEEYVWVTSNDEKVREGHDALNGTVQRWDTPPDTGTGPAHPGEDPLCRCTAMPIVPGLSGEA